MAKRKLVEVAQPDWLSRCIDAGTRGRYNSNDERGPAKHEFSPNGPLMRLVLASGFKAWRHAKDGPWQGEAVTLSEVKAMIDRRELYHCKTYKDAEFYVDGVAEKCGLWILWGGAPSSSSRNRVQVLAPCHRLIAERRAEEIKRRALDRSARDPKTPSRTMKTRGDTL